MSKELFEELKKEFVNAESEAIYIEVKEHAVPILSKLAEIQMRVLSIQSEDDKKVCSASIQMLKSSLADIALGAKDKGYNYAFSRLENFVKSVLLDKLLSKLLGG